MTAMEMRRCGEGGNTTNKFASTVAELANEKREKRPVSKLCPEDRFLCQERSKLSRHGFGCINK